MPAMRMLSLRHRARGAAALLLLACPAAVLAQEFEQDDSGCTVTAYQTLPAWSFPFRVGRTRVSFDGFIDIVGSHGACNRQVLSQTQLMLDVGNYWSEPGRMFLGVEWRFWDNVYGIDGVQDSFAQVIVRWDF